MQRRLLTYLCVLAASACHTFRPVTVDVLTAGQTIRARVTGAYSDSLSTILLRDARDFEGVVIESSGSTTLMEIPVEQAFQGMRLQTLNQRVEVPNGAFVDLEIKEFSRGRTLALMGIIGAAVGGAVAAQLNKRSGGSSRPGEGGPDDAIVPLPIISLPVGGITWIWGR